MKNKIILGDNKLWRNTHGVLLHIYCRGILNAESSKLILGSVISILATPTTWPIIIIKRFVHLIILLLLWVLFADFVAEYANIKILILTLVLLAIFYRDIYQEITEIIIYFLIVASAGGLFRWICQGYLNNAPLRQ